MGHLKKDSNFQTNVINRRLNNHLWWDLAKHVRSLHKDGSSGHSQLR